VGNIRTALFNWLFARHHNGTFIVRIEDTDTARKVEGTVDTILDTLRWLGMDWDEGPEAGGQTGPYFQSQRLGLHPKHAMQLISQGNAYRCYCTPQRLEEMRAAQVEAKQPPGYDRHCRNLTDDERAQMETGECKAVVRFKFPREEQTAFKDLIRGDVSFDNALIDDFVILKSDGYPTYHLASVVDDHLMAISHVLRAEEWLSSTPRHLRLYYALGFEPPQFAHLPIILGSDRSKLSKRHGAVSISEYRRQGYLPEAMVNFLILLGWSLDDKTEIMMSKELIENFSLERVSKTGAIFNQEKLEWMNGVYIRTLKPDEFKRQVLPFLERDLPDAVRRPLDADYVARITPLVQERAKTLSEVPQLTSFFFIDKLDYPPQLLIAKNMSVNDTAIILENSLKQLEGMANFDEKTLETTFRQLADELSFKTGQLFGTLRVAVTGQKAAPPLFQTMAVLGRECCLERVGKAIVRLRKAANQEH
jgi:glutamyl-tRNA synthetase